MTAEEILAQFSIPMEKVMNIYPYGSRVYGCHTEESDHDWVIVYRSSMLPSGAFRDNAISSPDRKHQATCYSRAGFRDAIDKYDIVALECIFLDPSQVVLQQESFRVRKWQPKEMASAVITKASASWHQAVIQQNRYEDEERARKGVFHAIRILGFGLQMAEAGKIVDYGAYNAVRDEIMNDENFWPTKYIGIRDNLQERLRIRADEAYRVIRAQAGEREP